MSAGASIFSLEYLLEPRWIPALSDVPPQSKESGIPSEAEPVSAPHEPEPTSLPAPAEAVEPAPAPVVLTDAESVICAVWGDLCAKALRVAACESGPDYYAGYSAHVGTFQIYPGHAGRFSARGWDYWTDGDDIYANSVIAYEIFLDSGWQPWPYCGYA